MILLKASAASVPKVEYNIFFGGNLANSAFAKYLSVYRTYAQNINIQFTCIQSVYEIENRYGGESTRDYPNI